MGNAKHFILTVAAELLFVCSPALAGSIRMLPPDQSNAGETTCLKGEGNKILSWDGENPIKCNVGVTVDTAGRVGIGTQTPTATLSLNNAGGAAILDINAPLANQSSIYFKNLTNGLDWALYRVDGSRNLSFWNPTGGQAITMLQANSNVGIGVPAPASKLDVAGGVKIANDLAACIPAKGGTIRWTGAIMEYCDGTAWRSFVRGLSDNCAWYPVAMGSRTLMCPAGRVATGIAYEGAEWSTLADNHSYPEVDQIYCCEMR